MKYDCLIYFLSAKNDNDLKAQLTNNLFTLKKICKEYKKVYFIELYSLQPFIKKNYLNNKIFYDLDLGNDVKFIQFFSNFSLIKFLKRKKIVGISYISPTYSNLLLHLIMSFFDIVLIQIQNVGHHQVISQKGLNITKKILFFYLNDRLSRKITSFLTIIGIFKKVQIRFVSNTKTLFFRKENFLKKIREKLNLFYVKEFILVNSRSYDIVTENIFPIEKKYIVVLDEQLNDPQYLRFRNKYSDEQIQKHYFNFNNYLKKLSQDLQKEVVITLHPQDDLNYKKNIFNEFNVVKFRTREFIFKSYLIIFFESSAIIDALILNKNIVSVKSNIFDINLAGEVDRYAKLLNLSYLEIDNFPHSQLNEKNLMEKGIIKSNDVLKNDYKEFLETYVCRETDKSLGYQKIIDEINRRYF